MNEYTLSTHLVLVLNSRDNSRRRRLFDGTGSWRAFRSEAFEAPIKPEARGTDLPLYLKAWLGINQHKNLETCHTIG